MKVKECVENALRLLNQYSIAGSVIAESYNAQGDDIARMVSLINDAEMEIAKTVRPISEKFYFEVTKENQHTGWYEIEKPEDYDRFCAIKFMRPLGSSGKYHVPEFVDASEYRQLEDGTIYLPTDVIGKYLIEYYRFPVHLDPTMSDADMAVTDLDNLPDTHEAIPYFVASMIALDSNTYAYAALNNAWETRLARLNNKPARAENHVVTDVYGFDHFHGIW